MYIIPINLIVYVFALKWKEEVILVDSDPSGIEYLSILTIINYLSCSLDTADFFFFFLKLL